MDRVHIAWLLSSANMFHVILHVIFPARADSYRDDGNDQFKRKKYKIAIDNYTEGIKSRSPDAELNAILYTNRAAAQFHLGNLIHISFVIRMSLILPVLFTLLL